MATSCSAAGRSGSILRRAGFSSHSQLCSPRLTRELLRPQLWSSLTKTRQTLTAAKILTAARSFHSSAALSSHPRISYRIAVSSSGKGRRFNPEKNVYNFDRETQDALGLQAVDEPPYLQKKKRPDSGDDAFFASKVGCDDSAVAFAVADGVGGWEQSRVDPGDFSHGLCGHMAQTAVDWDSTPQALRAKSLLRTGYDKCVEDPSIYAGGSTACVGVAYGDGKLELANLGDSGFLHLRLAAVNQYSVSQTHSFNAPYQLSIIPQRMRMQAEIFGGQYYQDMPQDATVTNSIVQHGDVLVLCTDGVLDNLNNQDILKVVTGRMMAAGAWTATADMGIGISDAFDALTRPGGLAAPESSRPPPPPSQQHKAALLNPRDQTLQALLAVSIAGEAKIASMDFRRDGPFAKAAQRYQPWERYHGGKVDDICALVLIAIEEGR